MTQSAKRIQKFFQARQSAMHHTVIDQVDALSQLLLRLFEADFIAVFYRNEAHEVLLPVTYQTRGDQRVAELDELEKRWLVKIDEIEDSPDTVLNLSSDENPHGVFDEFAAANQFSGRHRLAVREDGETRGMIVVYWRLPKDALPSIPAWELDYPVQILTRAVAVIRHIGTMDRFLMRLSLLAELFETDLSALRLPQAFSEIVRSAQRLAPSTAIALITRESRSGVLDIVTPSDNLTADRRFRDQLVERVGEQISSGRPASHGRCEIIDITVESSHPYSEIVAVEFHPEAKYDAVMVFCSERRGGLTDVDRELISVFASFAAILLHNAVLVKNLQKANNLIRESSDRMADTEAMAALTDMTSGIAHRLNNVIGSLIGRLQLMQVKVENEEVKTKLETLEQLALDAASTVKRIQEFATCTRSSAPMKSVDLAGLLQQYRDQGGHLWHAIASEKRIDVRFNLPTEQVAIAGIAEELHVLLDQLVLNAVEFGSEETRVNVSLRETEYHVHLSVTDVGVPIAREIQRKIHYPFFSTKENKDAGMGLAMVHSIVTRHGGRLNVDSTDDKTTITVLFDRPETVEDTGKVLQTEEPVYKDLNFLVADDDRQLREVVRDMLVLDGHEVTLCSDGYTALDRLSTKHYDVLITDLGMPGMSGLDLAGMAHEAHPDMPIIMITGWGTQLKEEEVAIRGIKAVLSKPFHLRDIKRLVGQVMTK